MVVALHFPTHNQGVVKASLLLGCLLAAGCGYPDFGFAPDAPAEVDSASPLVDSALAEVEDVPDTLIEEVALPDTTPAVDACASCAATEQCVAGGCRPYPSCRALHDAAAGLSSGPFMLDPDGAGPIAPFVTYCDMSGDGGGWTLALKADGAKKTFVYTSPLWENSEPLNPSSIALDTTEAKQPSFWTMPFTAIRLGMLDGGTRRYIRINVAGASLRALFAGPSISTSLGRAEWVKLLADPRLQASCNAEGINRDFSPVTSYAARARLGIFGNNEADCDSPDSYIGLGAGFVMPHACVGTEPGVVVGNFNPLSCGGSAGNERATQAFGYLFIR